MVYFHIVFLEVLVDEQYYKEPHCVRQGTASEADFGCIEAVSPGEQRPEKHAHNNDWPEEMTEEGLSVFVRIFAEKPGKTEECLHYENIYSHIYQIACRICEVVAAFEGEVLDDYQEHAQPAKSIISVISFFKLIHYILPQSTDADGFTHFDRNFML